MNGKGKERKEKRDRASRRINIRGRDCGAKEKKEKKERRSMSKKQSNPPAMNEAC